MSAPQMPFTQDMEQAAVHQRFSWAHGKAEHTPEATHAARTLNISHGISACASLIHASALSRENGDAPLLSSIDVDVLLRFVMESADMLAEHAERDLWEMNKPHREGMK
jgi:hypothetical protein